MHGQAVPSANVASSEKVDQQLLPGVVVEKVEKNSEAEKADLREGDVLLSWSRDDVQGKIESPFDVSWLDIEQRPRGAVALHGLRSFREKSWNLGQMPWSIPVRPNIKDALLKPYQMGRNLAKARKFTAAANRFELVASRMTDSQSQWLRSWVWLKAADAWTRAAQWKLADRAYERSAEHAAKCKIAIRAAILRLRAFSLRERGELDQAEKSYSKALEYLLQGSDSLVMADTFIRIGAVYGELDNLVLAADYYSKALAIQESLLPDQVDISYTLGLLAGTAVQSGDLSRAESYVQRFQRIDDSLPQESVYLGLNLSTRAMARYELGDLQGSELAHKRALKIFDKSDSTLCHCFVSSTLDNLGLISWVRGDIGKAERLFRKSVEIQRQNVTDESELAYGLNFLSVALLSEGKLARAENYARQAFFVAKKRAPKGYLTAWSLNVLGLIAQARGNLVQAEAYLKRAVRILQETGTESLELAEMLNDLGSFYLVRGDLAQATVCHQRALGISARISIRNRIHTDSLAGLTAVARRQNDQDGAAALSDQTLAALDAQTAGVGGSLEDQFRFRAKHAAYYRDYVDLRLSRKEPDRAFDLLERARARTLLEMLASSHIDVRKGVDPALFEREHSLQAEISAKSERRIRLMGSSHADAELKRLDVEISNLITQREDAEGEIRATSPAYAALTQPQPLTAKEVQTQLLDSDTLLLEYSLGEERSYVFALTPDSLNAFELPKRTVLEKAARRVYSLLTARNREVKGETTAQKQVRLSRAESEYPRAAAELSKMILGPVASQLQNKRLLIVTDGALAYIPFALLPEPHAASAGVSASAVPLVVNHEIVNLPSASVLAVLRQQQLGRTPAPKAVAVLADPVFDKGDARVALSPTTQTAHRSPQTRGAQAPRPHALPIRNAADDPLLDAASSAGLLTRSAADVGLSRNGELRLPRLPFSRREADAILAVTPEGAGKKAVDFDASRATATSPELGQYRIVHFATHGLLDSVHPELSGLVFSMVDKKGRPQNGFLELQDIYNLNLPADLVVLSACETGLGKEISGEGLVGLTRGFMYAGASRVVASLWKVSDAGTATLMASFYTAMEKEGLPPAAALRAAQVQMWKQKRWNFPYYWAAFQIQGEWK